MNPVSLDPTYRKITQRLVPFLMLLYMVAFLDRVNVSFAALTMNRDLGISESLYGFAAGVFFLGYCLFEVPANILLTRFGARRWLGLLLVIWGIVSTATAFVPNRAVYVAARCLLGLAEAGFYPGVVFYLTLWLPPAARARIMALFLLALPVCSCIGSPISSHILLMDRLVGLKGWQWLFLLEGSPAILLGVLTWFVLDDKPQSANWLSASEKESLERALAVVVTSRQPSGERFPRFEIVRDSAAYFLFSVGLYGLSFWLPKILAASGVAPSATGWWAALPYGVSALAMVVVSRQPGRGWLPAMYFVSAAGFVGVALFHSLSGHMVSFSLAASGIYGAMPLFWSAATARMNSKVAGSAIAIINSVGAVGAFTGPFLMGWLHDATRSYAAGLGTVAASMAVGAVLAFGVAAGPQKMLVKR